MIPYSFYFKLGSFVALALIISFFYIDYKRLQGQALDLTKQVENFKSDMMIQQEHIDALEYSFEKQKKIRQELDKDIKIVTKEVDKLQETVLKHDMTYLASKKPILIQNAINNGTTEMIRCLELATGSEIKANETNKTCPSLIFTE